jgi:hypothetical protein
MMIGAAVCGIAIVVSRLAAHRPLGWRARFAILPIWIVVATLAFLSGGQFHHHYWITLTFPLGVTAGVLVASVSRVAVRNTIAVLVLLPALWSAGTIIFLPRDEVPLEVNGDTRLTKEEHISRWLDANGSPGDALYTLCASASFYALADEDPPYPYLWFDNVLRARGAQDKLREMLTSATEQPRFVAVFQSPDACDPSGVTAAALAADYARVAMIDGIEILERAGE